MSDGNGVARRKAKKPDAPKRSGPEARPRSSGPPPRLAGFAYGVLAMGTLAVCSISLPSPGEPKRVAHGQQHHGFGGRGPAENTAAENADAALEANVRRRRMRPARRGDGAISGSET
jgi:hypothetical protein